MEVVKVYGTAYLIHDQSKGILIDPGMVGGEDRIRKKIIELGIQIPLIFLTHTHYDHTGCAEAVRGMTGAKVMVSEKEASCLGNGYTPIPKGTGSFGNMLVKAGHLLDAKRQYYTPVTKGIVAVDGCASLKDDGFDADVVPLGGHTAGSIGLKAGDHFFAGDTVFHIGGVFYPPFADFTDDIPAAWKTIINSGSEWIYPGHGTGFHVSQLEKQYKARFAASSG